MTYNVKGLQLSRPDVVAVVRAAAPDVLGVQEPPRGAPRLVADVAVRARRRDAGRGERPRRPDHGPARRTGPVGDRSRSAVRLPNLSGRTRRGVAVATVDGIRFVVVHLSLVRDERAAHLSDLLRDHVADDADRRARRPQRAPRRARRGPASPGVLVDADPTGGPTFPAVEPRQRIDAILRPPDLAVGSAAGPVRPGGRSVGSDHRPLVVDLTLLTSLRGA